MLTLSLGHTVAAASTVLAAFMGGLAAGAALAAPFAAACARADSRGAARVRALRSVRGARTRRGRNRAGNRACARCRRSIARASVRQRLRSRPVRARPRRHQPRCSRCSGGVMGATYPFAVASAASGAADAGALYAANTFGGAAGAIAAGFWLVPLLGLRGATWIGVTLNAAAAAGAVLLSRATPLQAREERQRAPIRGRRPASGMPLLSASPHAGVAVTVAAVSGCAALVWEVAWTRLLAVVLGPTTYAFATMAATFVTGIAIGSAAGARVARRTTAPLPWLGAAVIAGAVFTAVSVWFAGARLPIAVGSEVAAPEAAFASIVVWQALRVGALILPAAAALGAAFSLALAAAGGERRRDRDACRARICVEHRRRDRRRPGRRLPTRAAARPPVDV